MVENPAPARSSENDAAGYRFDHLNIGLILHDMYSKKSDPGPDDRVMAFDLTTLAGGRFRSADLAETGPVTVSAAPGLNA